MGASRADMASVQSLGFEGWIDAQFTLAGNGTRWDWLVANGYSNPGYQYTKIGFDNTVWRKMISSPDTLRQRITLALSELMVIGIDGLVGQYWDQFDAAAYFDLLEANAFTNFRQLLQAVSTSVAMGTYLTFAGSVKANPLTGSEPDENYARESMQLFTIGLQMLNIDGSPQLVNGLPVPTFAQADVSGLARIYTGWDIDLSKTTQKTPDYVRRPMVQTPANHETGASTFLGTTVPAGTNGVDALTMALDTLFNHPNVGPFVGRQLIQRLVSSNPSPGYVSRVAGAFNNNGSGVRGDMQAVVKAILLDTEARSDSGVGNPAFGKLREPLLRLTGWARAYAASSPSGAWNVGDTSSNSFGLGQSPGRSPSVFNFFAPGYVPPNTQFSAQSLQAPEFQITNESTVTGYINFMQAVVSNTATGPIGDVQADYSSLLPLASDAGALLTEINTVLAAGQLSAATLAALESALTTIDASTSVGANNRVYAALTLVLAAPEYLAQQ
jgi:uncharacterized protein (DUF1800 family)